MEKLFQLASDIAKLWSNYGVSHYLPGIRNTLILALVATAIGCLIGFVCGILNTIPHSKNDPPVKRFFLALIRAVVRIYVEIFRGTPMVLQAVFLYYGLPYFTDNAVRFDSIWMAAILVVSINTGAYMAESVRGGIISIDPGQTEGAKAIGMTHVQTMLHVILPQAIRNILPQIGNNFIINVKDTSVMFIIGFPDFFSDHRAAVGASYLYFLRRGGDGRVPHHDADRLLPAALVGKANGRQQRLQAGTDGPSDHGRRHIQPPGPGHSLR